MAALKDEVKLAIVRALACFDTPTEAGKAVEQEFGIKVDRAQVAKYDPTKVSGKNLSKKLAEIFHATRAAFLKDVSTIPVAQQAYRLRVIQKEVERAQSRGNSVLVAQLLEQAAKEAGGAFTNRRELTGRNGGPIPIQQSNVTPEQLSEAVRSVREDY